MGYVRKTMDTWQLQTNYGYGWEVESIYTKQDYEKPFASAKEDAKEYRLNGCIVRIVKKREKIS